MCELGNGHRKQATVTRIRRTLSTGSAAAATAEEAREPLAHCWTRARRQAGDAQLHPRDPSRLLAGRRRLKRGQVGRPLASTACSSSLEGCGPVRRSQSGHIHTWASGPPAPRQIFAPSAITTRSWHPHKRSQCPGQCLCRTGTPGQVAQGDSRAQIPGEVDSTTELRKSQGVFHRQKEGRPRQAPQGAGACTGGQRQSYKRAGYLARVSWTGREVRGPSRDSHWTT